MRLSLAMALSLVAAATAAHADTLQYTVSLSNSQFPASNVSFVTTGIAPVTAQTTLQPSQFTITQGAPATSIILDYQNQGGISVVHTIGSTIPAPAFNIADYSTIGGYTSTAYNTNGAGNNQTLTLTVANYVSPTPTSATPEPSSIALLGTGLLGIAGFVRRRLQ